jgi:aminoglycoside phosphotransferase (APT) family kinase protein
MTAPSAMVVWARSVLDAEALELTRLEGGTAAEIWRLCGLRRGGGTFDAVLKSARPGQDPDAAALIGREDLVLQALQALSMPVPVPIACDPDGRRAGRPTLLMSCMPGRLLHGVSEIRTAIPAMAGTLAACQRDAETVLAGQRWAPWCRAETARVPDWTAQPELWSRALAVVSRFPHPRADAFIHRDPHPANFLFDEEGVSALLDWPHAGRGPAGIDAARMAMNLACLIDLDAALRFRDAFETARGLRQDPLLDVHAAVEMLPDPDGRGSWSALGVQLTRAQARQRLEAFLADALLRMTSRRSR